MAPLLQVTDLQTHYVSFGGARVVKAVDGVSFTLEEGETLGLVGESGCGKTTTCQSIVNLLPAAARIVGGSISFMGQELTTMRPREMRHIRGAQIAMILQDPMASLNPLFSIYRQVMEPAYYHRAMRGRALRERVRELLNAVRIPSPAMRMREYPHQMSGGMRQRIVGAIALAGGPKLIIADEPTTNLDVTIQAQYLDLLARIAGADRGRDHLRHAQSRDRRAHVRQARGHVCRQDRRGRQRAPAVQRRPAPVHEGAARARCRSSAARKSCSRSRDSRPTSRPCRRAAPSTRAVPRRCRNVRRSSRPRCRSPNPGRRGAGSPNATHRNRTPFSTTRPEDHPEDRHAAAAAGN